MTDLKLPNSWQNEPPLYGRREARASTFGQDIFVVIIAVLIVLVLLMVACCYFTRPVPVPVVPRLLPLACWWQNAYLVYPQNFAGDLALVTAASTLNCCQIVVVGDVPRGSSGDWLTAAGEPTKVTRNLQRWFHVCGGSAYSSESTHGQLVPIWKKAHPLDLRNMSPLSIAVVSKRICSSTMSKQEIVQRMRCTLDYAAARYPLRSRFSEWPFSQKQKGVIIFVRDSTHAPERNTSAETLQTLVDAVADAGERAVLLGDPPPLHLVKAHDLTFPRNYRPPWLQPLVLRRLFLAGFRKVIGNWSGWLHLAMFLGFETTVLGIPSAGRGRAKQLKAKFHFHEQPTASAIVF